MKAKFTFTQQPFFNFEDTKTLAVPGILIGRAESRRMWTLAFTAQEQVNAITFIGNLKWLAAPSEQDFGKGIKFVLIANPKQYIDGKQFGIFGTGELLG